MEGSGYFMLIGRYKQSEGKKALNQGPNASPSASQR